MAKTPAEKKTPAVQLTRGTKKAEKNNKDKPDKGSTMGSIGGSGTAILSGVIREDYNASLSGYTGMLMFDKMRKSDAQVFATMLACELPIRSTKRFVDAARDENEEVSDEAKEIAQFIEDCLFKHMTITRDALLLEILTMLPFGFSLFEKVFGEKDGKVILTKLASRKQTTIRRRQMEDGQPGVEQRLPFTDDIDEQSGFVSIPADKILLFTFRQEGDNYEGVSILRSAYKHRRYKDELYKFDAVKHERQAVGIPVIYPAAGASEEDLAIAEEIVKNVRANEQGGIVMPGPKEDGRNFEFANMGASTTSDLRTSINHHNREISKNILAQFLELGNTESGSRALSEDQSDLFLLGLTAVANHICDIFNRFVIPELVDYNFNTDEYPHLKFGKLGSIDYTKLSGALSTLANSGIITVDETLETWTRDTLDLPSKMIQEGTVDEKEIEKEEPVIEKKEVEDEKEQKEEKIVKTVPVKAHDHSHDDVGHFDEEYRAISQMFDNRFIISLQNEAENGDSYADLKKKGFKTNDYEKIAFRPLTFAERKVNFVSLNKSLDTFENILDEKLKDITTEMKADLLKQVKKAVEENDIKAVGAISAKYTGKLSSALTEVQKEMFEIGKKTAAVEMNVQVPPTRKEVRGALRVQNDNIIDAFTNDIETQTKAAVLTTVNNNSGSITAAQASTAIAAASQTIDAVITKVANNLKTLGLIGAVNLGRATIFERYPEKVYGYQYSAILDERTTDYCRSLDGRVVKPGSAEFFKYMPPKHYNCRSIRVEILIDEIFKPEFTGIPSSIPAPATIDTFKPLKVPQLIKGSPAIKTLQVEIRQRKEKVEELKSLNKYPNRQAAHEERIDQLETALAKAMSEELYSETKRRLVAEGITFISKSE